MKWREVGRIAVLATLFTGWGALLLPPVATVTAHAEQPKSSPPSFSGKIGSVLQNSFMLDVRGPQPLPALPVEFFTNDNTRVSGTLEAGNQATVVFHKDEHGRNIADAVNVEAPQQQGTAP